MTFTEACTELAAIVNASSRCNEMNGLLISEFITYIEEDETPRMALALAKQSIQEVDTTVPMGNYDIHIHQGNSE